jgi:pyrroline-5-carboxylate reductase
MKKHIALIGAGNLGKAILDGLVHAGFNPSHIWATARSLDGLQRLQTRLGIHITLNNIEAVEHADIVILAVKPQIMPQVAAQLASTINTKHPLVISVAAGLSENFFRHHFGDECTIVRATPNTPTAIRCGVTVLYASFISSEQREVAENIFNALGQSIWLDDEAQFNLATAVSGSGPAYFFHMIEALQSTAKELGLSDAIAEQLTLQTILGSARMACEVEQSVQTLQEQVAPPGGGTEKALKVLEAGGFSNLIFNAVNAAFKHYQELAKLE